MEARPQRAPRRKGWAARRDGSCARPFPSPTDQAYEPNPPCRLFGRASGRWSRPPLGNPSTRFDCDLLHVRLHARQLRHLHRQHALRELGADLVGIDALGQDDRPVERTIATLGEIEALAVLRTLALLLAPDCQHAVRQRDLDILVVEAGHLPGPLDLLVGFGDIDTWAQPASAAAGKGAKIKPAPNVVK